MSSSPRTRFVHCFTASTHLALPPPFCFFFFFGGIGVARGRVAECLYLRLGCVTRVCSPPLLVLFPLDQCMERHTNLLACHAAAAANDPQHVWSLSRVHLLVLLSFSCQKQISTHTHTHHCLSWQDTPAKVANKEDDAFEHTYNRALLATAQHQLPAAHALVKQAQGACVRVRACVCMRTSSVGGRGAREALLLLFLCTAGCIVISSNCCVCLLFFLFFFFFFQSNVWKC